MSKKAADDTYWSIENEYKREVDSKSRLVHLSTAIAMTDRKKHSKKTVQQHRY